MVYCAIAGLATRSHIIILKTFDFIVKWKDVETIRLWEKRLEKELRERIDAGDFVGAYPFLAILIRIANPGYPDGTMLAILLGSIFAPLLDWFVEQANIRRRLARHA